MALWQMHSSWKHHLSLLMLFDVLPLLFLNDWKCNTLTPDSCVGFLIALPVLCNAKFLLICMWRLSYHPHSHSSSQDFILSWNIFLKSAFYLLVGCGWPSNPVCSFLCRHYGVIGCWWRGYWDDDSVEIYHNLRHCFTRGFETDGSVGFKT